MKPRRRNCWIVSAPMTLTALSPAAVCARTLEKPIRRDTTIIRDDVIESVRALKVQPGGSIVTDGSSQLVHALLAHDLVDELHLLVYPLSLGSGKRLLPSGVHTTFALTAATPYPAVWWDSTMRASKDPSNSHRGRGRERTVKAAERATYSVGGVLFLSGVIHLAILLMSGGTWEGPVSLRKAATFGLSFGLTLVNVTFIASFVPLKDRTRTTLLSIFAVACVLETFLVSLQAWRGVPSHFNVETPFDAAVARTLAVGGFTLVAIIVALTAAAFRAGTALPPGLRLAIRAGFVALVGAQIAGGVMIATGMRLVFGGDPQRAYAAGGWLKPVHAVLMHAILVLPMLAWLISRTDWDQRTQARALRMGIVLYALVVVAIVVVSVLSAGRSNSL